MQTKSSITNPNPFDFH